MIVFCSEIQLDSQVYLCDHLTRDDEPTLESSPKRVARPESHLFTMSDAFDVKQAETILFVQSADTS
jgi:hypothetical protein